MDGEVHAFNSSKVKFGKTVNDILAYFHNPRSIPNTDRKN